MSAKVLYISFDGVLQPLAFSQVGRVLAALGRRGVRYHLLSLEARSDLAREGGRSPLRRLLDEADVAWTPLAVDSMGSARRAAEAVTRVTAAAARIARRERVALVHARGYHGAVVALALRRLLGLPYVFDARGYWIEERAQPGGWFSSPVAYASGKLVEGALFRGASAVVTLTELQAADVAAGLFGPPPRLLRVIPTCADYDAFFLRADRPAQPQRGALPADVEARLAGRLVFGVVGALNATYFVRETLALVRRAIDRDPRAHLLVLSGQRREYEAALAQAGIPEGRATIASSPHDAMPAWLQWMDWGLLLVPETAANRAKMPTKLAEFFAAGVRPLFFGCNSDAQRWVERAGSGYVLRSVGEADLDAASRYAVESRTGADPLRAARDATASHFSLESGVERYRALVEECLGAARPR